jgi:ribA/ribD-fused uncharacterized protein
MSDEIKFWKGGNITSMTDDNIFVFGSNPEGRHGKGSAKSALKFGAKYSNGRGLQGNAYALVTKNLKPNYFEESTGITYKRYGEGSVSLDMISKNIDELYQCALDNSEKKFFIAYNNDSKNLNGYSSKQIWDVFTESKNVPSNIRFHDSFRSLLKPKQTMTDAGQRKREGMSKLKEAYEIAKETGNVRTATMNPNGEKIESKPAHGGMDYDQAIKTDNQPRENFTFFWHSPSPFSQWHPAKFTVKDTTFSSTEQFMMYCKAKLFKDEEIAQQILDINFEENHLRDENGTILDERFGLLGTFLAGDVSKEEILKNKDLKQEWDGYQKKVKALGRKVKNYDEATWVKHRVSYVAKGNFEKFTQNEDIKQELLKTDGTILSEANFYDKIWAIGIKESDANATSPSKWKGLNLLGKILTNLREKLKYDLKQEQSLENDEPQKKRRKVRP